MIIRAMTHTDLPGVLKVASDDRDHAQRAQPEFNEMFGSAALRPFFYIAEIEGEIVGIAGYGASWLAYGVYELFWIGVLKSHERRGIGKALIERCLADLMPLADSAILVTEKREFFEKCGFSLLSPFPTNGERQKNFLMVKYFKK